MVTFFRFVTGYQERTLRAASPAPGTCGRHRAGSRPPAAAEPHTRMGARSFACQCPPRQRAAAGQSHRSPVPARPRAIDTAYADGVRQTPRTPLIWAATRRPALGHRYEQNGGYLRAGLRPAPFTDCDSIPSPAPRGSPNLAPTWTPAISFPATAELPVLAGVRHLVSIQHVCPMPGSVSDRHTWTGGSTQVM
jgi:hypothetical protein